MLLWWNNFKLEIGVRFIVICILCTLSSPWLKLFIFYLNHDAPRFFSMFCFSRLKPGKNTWNWSQSSSRWRSLMTRNKRLVEAAQYTACWEGSEDGIKDTISRPISEVRLSQPAALTVTSDFAYFCTLRLRQMSLTRRGDRGECFTRQRARAGQPPLIYTCLEEGSFRVH